jgi:hypothetical protein
LECDQSCHWLGEDGRLRRAAGCVALVVATASCSGGGDKGTAPVAAPTAPAQPTVALGAVADAAVPVRFVSMPQRARAVCRTLRLMVDVCPRRVPAAPYRRARAAPGFAGPVGSGATAVCLDNRLRGVPVGARACSIAIFALEAGAPTRGQQAARPPHYVHVVFYATRGRLLRARFSVLPFAWPKSVRRPALTNAARTRGPPLLLAARAHATVVLAPPFPNGGEMGGHLIAHWQRDGIDYAASIHAWTPLSETAATLRALLAETR